jgi:hypothetical protein
MDTLALVQAVAAAKADNIKNAFSTEAPQAKEGYKRVGVKRYSYLILLRYDERF